MDQDFDKKTRENVESINIISGTFFIVLWGVLALFWSFIVVVLSIVATVIYSFSHIIEKINKYLTSVCELIERKK